MVRLRGTAVGTRLGPPRSRRGLALLSLGVGLSAAGMISGCGSDGLTPPPPKDLSELYWALELNHHAVALSLQAPYDTLPLVATPRTVEGAPLDGLPAVTYVSGDPEKVAVASDGVLRARAPTAPGEIVPVVAMLTAGNLKHVDTALVTVLAVDSVPVLASLSIHPIPNNPGYADSAKVGIVGSSVGADLQSTTCFALPTWIQTPDKCKFLLPVTVLDVTGDTISGVPVAFRSSDGEVAAVDHEGNVIIGNNPPVGQVTFYASTTVLGITKVDTLLFRIGWRVFESIIVSRTGPDLPVVKVGVGAIIRWGSGEPNIDISFADPTNVAAAQPLPNFLTPLIVLRCQFLAPVCEEAGNIVLTPNPINGEMFALRRFPVPGTYDYSSTALGGVSGRIIVIDERQ